MAVAALLPGECQFRKSGRSLALLLCQSGAVHHWQRSGPQNLSPSWTFHSESVFVISAIHQRRTICRAWAIYLGRTVGMILSYLSGRDDDQAVTRVLMPACTPSGQPRIALHVQV